MTDKAKLTEQIISAWAFAHNIDGAARNDLFARLRQSASLQERDDDALIEELDKLKERNQLLEEVVADRGIALAPFAEACSNCITDTERDEDSTWEHPVGMEVTIRDFREAKAACDHLRQERDDDHLCREKLPRDNIVVRPPD